MVELLTSKTFSAYGTVFRDAGDAGREPWLASGDVVMGLYEIKERSALFRISKNHGVYLENVSEPVLLFLSPDTTFRRRDIFLLDKPVIIKPGVLYCLNTLKGDGRVSYVHPRAARFELVTAFDSGAEALMLPQVAINKIYTLFYQEKEKGFFFKGECHNFWEFTYVDKGYMHTVLDGEEFVLHQGEGMFYDRGQHHVQYADKDVAVCFITITFDMELAQPPGLRGRKFSVDGPLAALLDKMLYEKEHSIFYSEDLISCYLKEFIITLMRLGPHMDSHTTYQHNVELDLVDRTAAYIDENISKRLTVGGIASHVNVSQSYLSVLFKKHRKYTLIEYINRARLERCKALLKEGRHSITKIAEIVGYSSVQYLSRQFKSMVGVSPSEYNKSQCGGEAPEYTADFTEVRDE